MEDVLGWALGWACVGGGAGIAVLGMYFVVRQFLFVSRPNEVLIFSGRQYQLTDGSQVGYRVLHGGWRIAIPFFEKVDRMELTTMAIQLEVHNAYSKGGIPLRVQAVAYVKVSSDPRKVNHAVERFLGRDASEIRDVAKESLEGHLRGIIARMTPEEVNEDRLTFAEELMRETAEDFDRLGLTLDALKVQSVSDDVAYLDSIGRERLANVLSTAEIAESTAKADAEEAQAEAKRQGDVANEQAETAIRQRENAYRQWVAELEAQAKSEEERAEQAALAARARTEQRLQQIRADLERLRLEADVVLPAESRKQASVMRARAEAATIAADGEALAEVLRMLTETWLRAGPDAKDIFLIQQLEVTLQKVTERVRALDIGEVTLLDRGDGKALAGHMAAMPAAVAALLDEFRHTTGVDVVGILTERREGDGVAAARPALTADPTTEETPR
ncbi:MAG: flotillin family protein [Alphaproteobacteria bacterium]|nr:flotillin family protein [Alphaproteobacteria bacterium]